MHVVGNFAYVADSSGLAIIDVSNPNAPTLAGLYNTPHNAQGVHVIGSFAYVADGNGGLVIINVSNPNAPTLEGSYDTPGNANSVHVAGGFAYVTDGNLQIIDVRNSSSPTSIGTCSTLGVSNDVQVVGNFAYVTNSHAGTSGSLVIIDVSNFSVPEILFYYETPGIALSVCILESFLYIGVKGGFGTSSRLEIAKGQVLLSGSPTTSDIGNYELEIIAENPDGNQGSINFFIRVEGPPAAAGIIPNQLVNVGSSFTYFIDQSVFPDPNKDVIFYSAKQISGASLPSWLSFSSIGIFSGIAQSGDTETLEIDVFANDGLFLDQVSTNFSLTVDHFPEVSASIPNQVADFDVSYSFAVPSETFTDQDVGDRLTYSATLNSGAPLPLWLSFNSSTTHFSGTPSLSDGGILPIEITATDGVGAQVETTFTLEVEHFPKLINPLQNQIADIAFPFFYSVPGNTFSDLDQPNLNFRSTQNNSTPLPNWLGFIKSTQEFVGTPQVSDSGEISILVIAEDSSGASAEGAFNLVVEHFPEVSASIPNQIAEFDVPYSFTVPSQTFTDLDVGDTLTYSATLSGGSPLPSWLSFNNSAIHFSGTPSLSDGGILPIKIMASDSFGAQAETSFNLEVEHFPKLINPLQDQMADIGHTFFYAVPGSTFSDLDQPNLNYRAMQNSSAPLPNWLGFVKSTQEFVGTPQASDSGSISIVVVAEDLSGASVEDGFNLIVEHFPKVTNTLPDQPVDIDQPYSFTVPAQTFTDEDVGDTLTYFATLSSDAPLPTWLNFNATTLQFLGTPQAGDAGSLSVKLSAADTLGAVTSTSFTLEVEHFPRLHNPIPNQLAAVGQRYLYSVSTNSFSDEDGDQLTYRATKGDGSILPPWLGFVGSRIEFQGTPLASNKGELSLKVIAEDPKGGSATSSFSLNVVDTLSEEIARVGGSFVYTVPNDMIASPLGPVTYTVTLGDGSPLPTWLNYNPTTNVISGTPPSNTEGLYNVLVTADDGVQSPVLGTVSLSVGTNAGPEVANPISNQVAQVDQKFRLVVPDDTFVDANGDSLTLSAQRTNGRALPSWLTFSDRTLEGKPGPSDTGDFNDKTIPLQICATDGDLESCTVFDLSVQGTSKAERALEVGGPLLAVGAAGIGWYKKRGVVLNSWNRNNYDKGTKNLSIGSPFNYEIEAPKDKIKKIQAFNGRRMLGGLPAPKNLDEKGWLEWLKHDRPINGGALLPSWLTYKEGKNIIESSLGPQSEDKGEYIVRAYGHGEVILEQVTLNVGGDVEMYAL